MKNHPITLLTLTTAAIFSAITAGCSERKSADTTVAERSRVEPAPATAVTAASAPMPNATMPAPLQTGAVAPTDIFAESSNVLRQTTRERVSELTVMPDLLNKNLDTALTAWKAAGGQSDAATENTLAMARTDFTQKVRTLTLAGDDTWTSAKTEAQTSLANLQRSWNSLIAGKPKN